MQIVHHKPAARGVSQLMYVGDDQAVEGATSAISLPVKIAIAAAIGWLLLRSKA
jgi:hypothetical protein